MAELLRVLLVGDNPEARALAIQELRREFPHLDVTQVVEGGGLVETMGKVGRLLSGLANELSNPLATIRGQAMLLRQALADSPHAEPIDQIAQAAERCLQLVDTFCLLAQQQSGLQVETVVRGKRILVVDDEPGIAAVLVEVLQLDGHKIETVSNGERALAKLAAEAYDLILSDIRMPDMDGPTLYREIERCHSHLLRRFIFLTGDIMSQEISQFLEQTGVPYLRKPFTLEMVRDIVQRTLSEKDIAV